MRHVGDAVRIVAGRAGGLVVHDVLAVKRETLVRQNARAVVAFVAERVLRRTFHLKILRAQIAFEQRRKNRAVWTVRTGAASGGTRVAVVTIRATDLTLRRHRRDETRHGVIFPNRFERMETLVRGGKLQAHIRLDKLPRHRRRPARDAVGVAAETEFVFVNNRIDDRAAGVNTDGVRDGAGKISARRRGRRVRIMAISASDVACRRINRVFVRAVRVAVQRNRMHADFLKIRRDIFCGQTAVVTNETILFQRIESHQKLFRRCVMRGVAIVAGDFRNRLRLLRR